MRTRMNTSERVAELLRFGRRHFAHTRFDAVSMDEIARRAGVSKALLYKYFGGRRGFFLATVAAISDEVIELLEMDGDGDLHASVRDMLRRFLGFAQDNRELYLLLVGTGLGADDEAAAELERVRDAALASLFATLGTPAPTSYQWLVAYGWVSSVERTTARWLDMPEVSFDEAVTIHMAGLEQLLRVIQETS